MRRPATLLAALLRAAAPAIAHHAWGRHISRQDASRHPALPGVARAQVALSMGLWLTTPTLGRWIAAI